MIMKGPLLSPGAGAGAAWTDAQRNAGFNCYIISMQNTDWYLNVAVGM